MVIGASRANLMCKSRRPTLGQSMISLIELLIFVYSGLLLVWLAPGESRAVAELTAKP